MKRKYSIILLSALLILQVFIYLNSERELRKEVIVPHAQTIEVESTLETQTSDVEEIVFDSNPVNEYYLMNPDYVGWLTIEDTAIDYPVVRASDNDFYLNHNFYKDEDVLGAIFMDYRNIGMGQDKHSIIYGHYMKNGQMFKDLDRFLSEEFLLNHSEFTLNDAFSNRTYKIFSVHYSDANPALIDLVFEDDEFSEFTESLKEQSLFQLDTEVSADNQILTLVTCNYIVDDGRLFVHAVEQAE